MFIIFVFLLGRDRLSGLLFFVLSLLPILTSLLPYLILAVPFNNVWKTLCMISTIPIAILNGTFFLKVQLQVHIVYSERKGRNTWSLLNLNI